MSRCCYVRPRNGYRWSFSFDRLLVELLENLLRSSGCLLGFLTLLSLDTAPIHASGFITAPIYDVGPNATSAVVGDFNGDGIPDLVVANSGQSTVSVILGNSDGTFRPARSYTAGSTVKSVAVGDFNSDGKLDLAVANDGSGYQPGVSILLGNGNGTFRDGEAAHSFAAGSNPTAVAVGDFNGDGILDLAVVNNNFSAFGTVSILLGKGNGTFGAPQDYAVGFAPGAVSVTDFNGDGIPDLAVANQTSDTVSVLLGNGDGTFQAAQDYAVGSSPDSVAVADFNGDGIPDLAVANKNWGTVSILLGKGDGTFQAVQTYAASEAPSSLAVADFNGDGIPDLAVANVSGVSMLLGNGDGSFQSALNYPASSGPSSVVVADFNGDGIADLAVTNFFAGTMSIFFGKGDGTFQAAQSFTVGSIPLSVAEGDFNADGIPDLAVANGGDDTVSILLGNGDGTFQAAQNYSAGLAPTSVAVGDFNGDGRLDLAVANSPRFGYGSLSILLGNGDGTFQAAQSYDSKDPTSLSYPSLVAVGDFNGDGIPDLAVSIVDVTIIFLGKGDGTFQAARVFPAAAPGITSIVVADVDGDGKDDIVTTSYLYEPRHNTSLITIGVYLSNGDGSFRQAKAHTNDGGRPMGLVVRDLNGDGIPDLAVAYSGVPNSSVSVYLGHGDGTFELSRTYSLRGHVATSATVADFNQDGKPDLAVADWSGVNIFLGNGDGTFQAPQIYAAGPGPSSVTVGDINRDGYPDLAGANPAGYVVPGTVTILINTANWP